MKTLAVTLVVLTLLAVGGDRLAARFADGQAESQLVSRGVVQPHVTIHGFPFLTQALRKRFDHVTVTAASVRRGDLSARDVHADLRDVRVLSTSSGTAGQVTGDGVVPWSEIATVADLPVTLSAGPDGTARVTGSVTVLGQTLSVAADATVTVVDDEIRIRPTRVSLASGGLLDTALTQTIERRLELAYPIRGLPAGVQVTSLTPETDGVRAHVTATDIGVS